MVMAQDASVVERDASADPVGFATCPSCHAADSVITNLAVSGGAAWRCWRCGQHWDGLRLATVAAYAVWVSNNGHLIEASQRPRRGDQPGQVAPQLR